MFDLHVELFGAKGEIMQAFLRETKRFLVHLHSLRRTQDLIRLYERIISMKIEVYGEKHKKVMKRRVILGRLYEDSQRYREASVMYRGALGTLTEAFGDFHPNLLELLGFLGGSLVKQWSFEEAEKVFE